MFRKIFKGIRLCICNFFMLIFRIFPINKRKIFVTSYHGKGYGDNPKYIVEQLLKQDKNFQIVWGIKKGENKSIFPKSIKVCQNFSLSALFHLATAKLWIDNCRKAPLLKRKNQLYIQTWHGFALKRIEKDVAEHLSKYYVYSAIADSKKVDLIISDSTFMTSIYKNSFWYDGEIVEWGSPRNDILIKGEASILSKVRAYFNISEDKKIVLYAPTFRVDYSTEAYGIDYNRMRESCQKRFGGEFVVLVRLHPNIIEKCKDLSFKEDEIINATYYPDMQELLLASDICISDYSSLMFDFALSKKPCFQFATDIEEYKQDRNFYFEIDKLPFPLCKDNSELEKEILSFNEDAYRHELGEFFINVGMIMSGNAAHCCAEWIIERIG